MPTPTQSTPDAQAGHVESVRNTLGWFAGIVIVFCAGWGFLYLDWQIVKHYKLIDPDAGAAYRGSPTVIGWFITFFFFLFLERNFWLSRLSGFKVYPNA